MAHVELREKAREMRREGKSIRTIAMFLPANKSTVSYWCRDISLTSQQISHLSKKQRGASVAALLKASEARRRKRIANVAKEMRVGERMVGTISRRDLFMLGLGLYWGEGYKSGNEELGFTNSDPLVIRTFVEWMEAIYEVKKSDMIARVSINRLHAYRTSKVVKFWSEQTGIPIHQFSATSLMKSVSRKKYPNSDTHFGTLRIKVRRGTSLRRRILGSLSRIGRQR